MASKWWRAIGSFMRSHRAELAFVLSVLAELDLLAIRALGIEFFTEFDRKVMVFLLWVLPLVALGSAAGYFHKIAKKRRAARA